METTFFVSLDMHEAEQAIDDAIVRGSITGERIDAYTLAAPSGSCIVLVYEKHYYRAGNRLTLTAVIDDFTGKTRVHCIGGGGGQGLFRFDFGASKSFSGAVTHALQPYCVEV